MLRFSPANSVLHAITADTSGETNEHGVSRHDVDMRRLQCRRTFNNSDAGYSNRGPRNKGGFANKRLTRG